MQSCPQPRMKALGILCLFIHGVQIVASKGLLQRIQRHDTVVAIEATEPPVFVANAFLAHSHNEENLVKLPAEVGRRRHWASAEDHKTVKTSCQRACGSGLDSGCLPECQVRLYECLDYDRKSSGGAKQQEDCDSQVLARYSTFSKKWEDTHPLTTDLLLRSKGAVTSLDMDHAHDECVEACGSGVDTSCVPECQVKIYHCMDHDRKVPEGEKKYQECEKEVLDAYRKFAADWEKTHPYLLAIGHHAAAKDLALVRDKCATDCGSDAKKSCSARCQTSAYSCLKLNSEATTGEFQACSSGVKSAVAKQETASSASAEQIAAVEKACLNACGLGLDSSCVPECQMQMFSCVEKNNAKESNSCTREVIERYEMLAADWNAAHPYLLAKRGHADAETLEELKDGCVDACGPGVDSSCVPECQVQAYTCLDHDRKTKDGAKKYNKCKAEVLAKYEKFADDWDKTHPYLLAVRRHISAVELDNVHDKCEEACGKGVDSSCVPECQVEMYQCLDHDRKTDDGAKQYSECESKVVTEYTKFGKKWDETHPY